jgi:FixJ family two-component response regulator
LVPSSNGGAPVIVLVDDDPALLAALKFAFETDGFTAMVFSDAESMLAAGPQSGACLVLDQNLPGISGLELLDRLRAEGVDAPAVLITTHPSPATRKHAHAARAKIVEKPLLSDALSREVKRLIRGATNEPG